MDPELIETIQTLIINYAPMIANVIALIVAILKICKSSKDVIASAASKAEVNELRKEVRELKDYQAASLKESSELRRNIKELTNSNNRIKKG